ncbi:hypothetical protein SASPL_123491 [Salvia splendens]|uniref:Uncharacterized protein n=1 Tax=Salvia splendens TaxID=180675 RepID=A0A8X8ZT86_SALSN|nr:hypothetical protein SASPL_123491 [Salvia splendens]
MVTSFLISSSLQTPVWYKKTGSISGCREEGTEKTVTTYRKVKPQAVNKCNKDYARAVAIENVVVLATKMEQREWDLVMMKQFVNLQSPRRQCCDIDGNLGHRTMRIRIRRCRHSETITI